MDVLEIARQRRSALEQEISRLDEFIRMGEELARLGGKPAAEAPRQTAPQATPAEPGQPREQAQAKPAEKADKPAPNTVRQFSAGSGASASS